jgi:AsmA protein
MPATIKSPLVRALLWVAGTLATLLLLAALFIAVAGWNWLRAPIERRVQQQTGRELSLSGDLKLGLAWPLLRLQAAGVAFANPAWAQQKQMLSAQGITLDVDLIKLLRAELAFTEVRLDHAVLSLERSPDGRKSWLLDLNQQDNQARIEVGRVALEYGSLSYDDLAQQTSLRAELATNATGDGQDLRFSATGKFKGQAVAAQGSGGPVLALRDTGAAYPLSLKATLGRTRVQLAGQLTGLLALSALDMQMTLAGDSLEQLYPLLGIAFPATRAYSVQGHLLHSGQVWALEGFSGRVGASDLAGTVQITTGGKRPVLKGSLKSGLLVLDDLGPVIGARSGSLARATQDPQAATRVLPDLPFNTERWDSVDADVDLLATTLRRAKALPLDNLRLHLQLRDSVLTLDPLNFGLAGGQLDTRITLDGQKRPIQAHAQVQARKLQLAKLFPTVNLNQSSLGQINGEFDLRGSGDSVGKMLASADGKLGLVVAGGQISRLMLEEAGLHLWEILNLNLSGDKLVTLRCAVADFAVSKGQMQTRALVFDTRINTLTGSGSINLAQEQLDLTLTNRTKNTSPLALPTPIHIRGSLARPKVSLDAGRLAVRAGGALALGLVNPLLALLPLIDAGPGRDSDCGQLVREAREGPKTPVSPGQVRK